MAQDYGRTDVTETQDNLIGGDHQAPPIAITLGSGDLERGAVLGRKTADGKYYEHNPSGSDGTENAVAILSEDCDASEAAEKTSAYFHGEFRVGGLKWKTGTNNQQKLTAILALQARGVYVLGEDLEFATWSTTTTTEAPTTTTAAPTTTTAAPTTTTAEAATTTTAG